MLKHLSLFLNYKVKWVGKLTKEGPEKILEVLKKNSEDEDISKFLECLFNKERNGIHFWNKEYEKKLNKYSKSWGINDEN